MSLPSGFIPVTGVSLAQLIAGARDPQGQGDPTAPPAERSLRVAMTHEIHPCKHMDEDDALGSIVRIQLTDSPADAPQPFENLSPSAQALVLSSLQTTDIENLANDSLRACLHQVQSEGDGRIGRRVSIEIAAGMQDSPHSWSRVPADVVDVLNDWAGR